VSCAGSQCNTFAGGGINLKERFIVVTYYILKSLYRCSPFYLKHKWLNETARTTKYISQWRISRQSHAMEPTYFSTIFKHIHLCCSASYRGTCWRTSYGPIVVALHKASIEPDMKVDTHAQCHVTSIRMDVKISHSKLLAICVWWYTSLLWTSDHHLWSVGCNVLHGGWCLTVRDNR